jgi:hypothetical protein
MNNEITREEMEKILRDTIYHLSIDRSKSSWDDRDYERLDDSDYYDLSCEIALYVNETLLNHRTEKIMKIKKLIEEK